jgi:hypothetical protein
MGLQTATLIAVPSSSSKGGAKLRKKDVGMAKVNSVTRLGEFSQFGRLFTLYSFLKTTEVAEHFRATFFHGQRRDLLVLTQHGFTWSDFFTNSLDHPAGQPRHRRRLHHLPLNQVDTQHLRTVASKESFAIAFVSFYAQIQQRSIYLYDSS